MPLPSRPPITRLCCVDCGVENSVFDRRNNRCAGCGGMLFRPAVHPMGATARTLDAVAASLVMAVAGVAVLAAGGWMIIGVVVIILVVPVYLLFAASVPGGVILVLVVAAWLLHQASRPEAIARRGRQRHARRVRRELKRIPDDLPI